MLHISTILKLYKRPEIQEAIVNAATNREVAVKFNDKGFGKRPDVIQYPQDVLEFAKQGASSFHVSEEHWRNPLQLNPSMQKNEVEDLREAWDLVLDIDCKFWNYSKLTTSLLIKALKHHRIKSISCKFSGNKGFHIGVPFKAFPKEVNGVETRLLFPDAARKVAAYLEDMIRKPLIDEILSSKTIKQVAEEVGMDEEKLMKNNELNPFVFVDIDTILIAPRHLYRMPYSLHEKSGLASVPFDPEKVMEFDKKMADPENLVVGEFVFLDGNNVDEGEGRELLIQALDFKAMTSVDGKTDSDLKKLYEEVDIPEQAIPMDLFPPCIKIGLQGLKDGKKRFMFALMNFLRSCGYGYDQIDEIFSEWNKKNNPDQLREVLIKGQIRYHKQHKKNIMPPNCNKYYPDLGICKPDGLCQKIKNPVQYSKRKAYFLNLEQNSGRQKLTEEQKEMRRKHREKLKKGELSEGKQEADKASVEDNS